MGAGGGAGQGAAARPPVFIVSGGVGAAAEQLVQTVLAQFPAHEVPVLIHPHVRSPPQLGPILDRAAATGGTLVHTLVDATMRDALVAAALARGIAAIDLTSELLTRLGETLGVQAAGQPGRYRELRQAYFDRVAAIEFAIAKDDGLRPGDWSAADAVLVGLSRVGKTPLSVYLAINGWKVANVPIVVDLPLPAALSRLDRRRLFGLVLDHEELLAHRRHRQRELGIGAGDYTDARRVFEEVEWARKTLRRLCGSIHDVSGKPIETTAGEITRLLTERFGGRARR